MKYEFNLADPVRNWLPVVIYPGFRLGLPDIVLGKLPEQLKEMAGTPYKSWIIENPKEAAILERKLSEPLPVTAEGHLDFISGPDAAVRKKSARPIVSGPADVPMMLYSPPEEGWPYLLLICWPMHNDDIERGRYTWEPFEDADSAIVYGRELIRGLDMPVDLIGPDSLRHN